MVLEEFFDEAKKAKNGMRKAIRDSVTILGNKWVLASSLAAYDAYSFITDNYLATAAATAALTAGTVQYIRGKFPFTRIPKNEFQPLQLFNDFEWRSLRGPGTELYIPGLEKKVLKTVDGNKVPDSISAEVQEDVCSIHFRTKNNLEGDLTLQFLWRVPDPISANRFYWDLGQSIKRVVEVIQDSATSELARTKGEDVAAGGDYLRKARKNANIRIKELGLGVELLNYAIVRPDFDASSQEVLTQVVKAEKEREATVIKAAGEAKRKRILAQGDAEANQRQAVSENLIADIFLEAARKYHSGAQPISMDELRETALRLRKMANNERLAEEGMKALFDINIDLGNKKK